MSLDMDQIMQRLAVAMDTVDDGNNEDNEEVSGALSIVAAVFMHLLTNPDAVPALGQRLPADAIVEAMKDSWGEDEWGADWLTDALIGASPEAAERWRALAEV